MMAEYDIIVAGGGPAGLQFAREVGHRTEFSIAVLETNQKLTDNDKSTGGTFGEVLNRFDIPDDVVMSRNSGVMLEGPSERTQFDIENYVLDFPALLDYLGEDAAEQGVDIHTATRVLEPLVDDGTVTGVRCRRNGDVDEITADVTVDATGPAGTLTSQLEMWDRDAAQRGIGKEFEVKGTYDLESLLFKFDHEYAPGGYAWVFPAGEDVFKIGVCWIDDFYGSHTVDQTKAIDTYIEHWADSDDRWEVEERRAVHAGEALSDNSINKRADDGIVAVGDAVSSINPIFGEGIRPGMESAHMAANAVISALQSEDTSEASLATYEQEWNRTKGRKWKTQRMVGELLYDFSKNQQDRFVRRTADLSPEQIDRFKNYELTVFDLAQLYPPELKDMKKMPTLFRHLV
jgi:digeranylgeranylglycerophospholipid reductase